MYRRPASGAERDAALYLAEILTTAERAAQTLERRIGPQGRARVEEAARAIDEELQRALDSMPDGARQLISRTARNSVIRIAPRSVGALGDGYLAVSEADLEVLALASMGGCWQCCMCMRTGDELRRCPLRPVLRRIYEAHDSRYGMCGYAGIPLIESDKFRARWARGMEATCE